MSSSSVELLENERYIPLLVLESISSSLSILGSGSIIYMAYKGGQLKTHIMQRLMFALSIANMALAAAFLLSPFLIPSHLNIVSAVGNEASCTAVGFMFTLFFKIGAGYNCLLSIYFLLTIRWNWREHDFKMLLEIVAHVLIFLFPLAVDISAVMAEAYNPHVVANQLCGYGQAPLGCQEGSDLPCERSSVQESMKFFRMGGTILAAFCLVGFFCTFLVWATVRCTLRKSMSYRFESAQQQNTIVHPPGRLRRMSSSQTSFGSRNDHDERIRKVSRQAILYSLVFLNTIAWPIFTFTIMNPAIHSFEELSEKKLTPGFYALLVLFVTMAPLQGALNFFVYTRPKVRDWRKAESERSIVWIYKQIVSCKPLPHRGPSRRVINLAAAGKSKRTLQSGGSRSFWVREAVSDFFKLEEATKTDQREDESSSLAEDQLDEGGAAPDLEEGAASSENEQGDDSVEACEATINVVGIDFLT